MRIRSLVFLAQVGDYFLKPRDVSHTFWNPGPAPLRILELIWPPSFDFYFDWVPELKARYGLSC